MSVRKLLWLRALHQSGKCFADSALAARDAFVQVCLMGQRADDQRGPPTVQQAAKVCLFDVQSVTRRCNPEGFAKTVEAMVQCRVCTGASAECVSSVSMGRAFACKCLELLLCQVIGTPS